jgi:3-hydroxybutyryl-CoA dehydrogenase
MSKSEIKTVGIVGAGLMGTGIAEVAAAAGYPTVVVKATPGSPDGARAKVEKSLAKSVEKGKLARDAADAILGRITWTTERDALSTSDVVIESIVEDLATKQQLFAQLDQALPQQAIFASNTSTLRITDLAKRAGRADRTIGLHFFSPVPAMKLVEVASTAKTYPVAVERAQELARALGKTPVMVGDTSGYIVNRLLVPYLLDGISALESRVASAEAIDTAMKLGCGHPMGPLALADAIGLDVVYAMAKTMHRELRDARYSPPALLRRLVLNNHLGKKTKLGIYDYSTDPARENVELWPAETRLGA